MSDLILGLSMFAGLLVGLGLLPLRSDAWTRSRRKLRIKSLQEKIDTGDFDRK